MNKIRLSRAALSPDPTEQPPPPPPPPPAAGAWVRGAAVEDVLAAADAVVVGAVLGWGTTVEVKTLPTPVRTGAKGSVLAAAWAIL